MSADLIQDEIEQRNALRVRIKAKVLAQMRHERGNPNWRPTGMLNGGAEISIRTDRRLKRLLERLG